MSVDGALGAMPSGFTIKPFLISNRAEVKSMCFTEYDEERTMRELAEDSKREGVKEGKAQGREQQKV